MCSCDGPWSERGCGCECDVVREREREREREKEKRREEKRREQLSPIVTFHLPKALKSSPLKVCKGVCVDIFNCSHIVSDIRCCHRALGTVVLMKTSEIRTEVHQIRMELEIRMELHRLVANSSRLRTNSSRLRTNLGGIAVSWWR